MTGEGRMQRVHLDPNMVNQDLPQTEGRIYSSHVRPRNLNKIRTNQGLSLFFIERILVSTYGERLGVCCP